GHMVVSRGAAQLDRDRVHRRGGIPRRALWPLARGRRQSDSRQLHPGDHLHPGDAAGRPGAGPLPVCADARNGPARWLRDGRDWRDRGGVPGPLHPAIRRLPVHRPHRPDQAPRARGRRDREAPPTARRLACHRVAGVGFPGPLTVGEPAPPVALYIHIPFCVSLCPYCDFVVYAGATARGPKARVAAFVPAVLAELDLRADALDATFGREPPALETVYLGGGTPSLLPESAIGDLIDAVRGRFGIADGAEVTLEANPGPDERGDAAALRAFGIPRRSIGAQAMSAAALRRLGRRHRVVDVVRTVAEARAADIASISLDLLYDAPDATVVDRIDTLDAALALEPDHLSLYALTLDDPDAEGLTGPDGDHLPTTRGARRWREFARPAQDEDPGAAQQHHAVHRLTEDGWRGYEISNWSRPGHESRHNLSYWQRRACAGGRPRGPAGGRAQRRSRAV